MFNWSEVHFFGSTSYKIHTLGGVVQFYFKFFNEFSFYHKDISTDSKMHSSECKATQYSPKARLGALIGFKPPFDRHDCVIDRDGKEVRYIVDYYHDKDSSNPDATKIDVRPALDSLDAFQVPNLCII